MFNDHDMSSTWECDICGEAERYSSESDFVTHLTEIHQGAIPADQIPLFLEMCCKKTVEEISTCPLCSWAEDADYTASNTQLLEHVAEHIHAFALRSLPWAPDKDEDDRATFEKAFAKVEDWFAKINPEAEGSGYKSSLPVIGADGKRDDYFHAHEYFAESSRASSLAPTLSSIDDDEDDYDESDQDSQSVNPSEQGSLFWDSEHDDSEDQHHLQNGPVYEPEYPTSPITIKVIDAHGHRIFMDPPSPKTGATSESAKRANFAPHPPGYPSQQQRVPSIQAMLHPDQHPSQDLAHHHQHKQQHHLAPYPPGYPSQQQRVPSMQSMIHPHQHPSQYLAQQHQHPTAIRPAVFAAARVTELSTGAFPCPLASYGCSSGFSSKNEWKRHVSTQHIKLHFWRCDLCPPTADPNDPSTLYFNDFNRKDLFTQHLRRMHAAPSNGLPASDTFPVNEDNLSSHQTRCLQSLRKAPKESCCPFCDRTFTGPSSWEERMEHVGRHLEKGASFDNTQNRDYKLEGYLLKEGLITREDDGHWAIGNGKPLPNLIDSDGDE